MAPPYFCIFGDYLPYKENHALDLYNFKSPLRKNDLYKFDWNWSAGSGEGF
jgi:hypothetical protein